MYSLIKLRDKIWLLSFDDPYDMAMHFLRYQEFYESPNPRFKGQIFGIFNFMEWYAKDQGKGVFTYPDDWIGFNIPSSVFEDIYKLGIIDKNKYDRNMKEIYDKIREEDSEEFYLMGALDGDEETIEHELAHALWAIDSNYQEKMLQHVSNLPDESLDILNDCIVNGGYDIMVVYDEMQAYLSTGLSGEMCLQLDKTDIDIEAIRTPFSKTFKKYQKNT